MKFSLKHVEKPLVLLCSLKKNEKTNKSTMFFTIFEQKHCKTIGFSTFLSEHANPHWLFNIFERKCNNANTKTNAKTNTKTNTKMNTKMNTKTRLVRRACALALRVGLLRMACPIGLCAGLACRVRLALHWACVPCRRTNMCTCSTCKLGFAAPPYHGNTAKR